MSAKSIITQAIIESVRSKRDKSVGLTISTPELSAKEKTVFFELQGIPIDLKITPLEEDQIEEVVVDKDLEQKSQSQRIRNCLWLIWKQNPEEMTWDEYYHNKTEKYISKLKSLIDE